MVGCPQWRQVQQRCRRQLDARQQQQQLCKVQNSLQGTAGRASPSCRPARAGAHGSVAPQAADTTPNWNINERTAGAHLVQLLAAGMHAAEHVHGSAACKKLGKDIDGTAGMRDRRSETTPAAATSQTPITVSASTKLCSECSDQSLPPLTRSAEKQLWLRSCGAPAVTSSTSATIFLRFLTSVVRKSESVISSVCTVRRAEGRSSVCTVGREKSTLG